MRKSLGIKIGADPEFCFKNRDGMLVNADEVLRDRYGDELGIDASSDTAELRPPFGSYSRVNRNISRLLSRAQSYGYKAYAGSGDVVPLGGHIHFSGIEPSLLLQNRLNKFIARPLNSISNKKYRYDEGYGKLRGSDTIRYNDHGWEYRAPASWLSTPILTKGALAIAWVLARACKTKHIGEIDTQQQLLDYAYKSERPAITLFFEAVKNYNDNNIKLEQIEIFAAWGKGEKIKPTFLPEFTNDIHMLEIQNCVLACVAKKHSSCRCFRPLLFYGASEERTKEKVVYTFLHLHMNNFGATIEEGIYGGDWSIGLSYNLRKDTKRCLWIIKRIIKAVNDEYRKQVCAE